MHYMVRTRARERIAVLFPVLIIISVIAVGIWMLMPGPSPTKTIEDRGFTDVKVADDKESLYQYTASVNGCTVNLYRTVDTEVWNVMILTVNGGKSVRELPQPEAGWTFLNVRHVDDLKGNARFISACPTP